MIEVCSNCSKEIGRFQQAYIFRDKIVCAECDMMLRQGAMTSHNSPQPQNLGQLHLGYEIIALKQRTQEWIKWRHNGIGASDAPIIMGENPWKTAQELLREKRGPARASKPNDAMSRGIKLEPQARKFYIARTGNDVKPACLQSKQYSWLHASVDGISSNGNVIVEIKCGESVYQHTSESGCVPDYYYGQLQHILAVSGITSIDFWCYLPRRPKLLIPVPRNEEYIIRLLIAENNFWNNVQRRSGLLGWIFGS
jgi:putative phage-type endonuclease